MSRVQGVRVPYHPDYVFSSDEESDAEYEMAERPKRLQLQKTTRWRWMLQTRQHSVRYHGGRGQTDNDDYDIDQWIRWPTEGHRGFFKADAFIEKGIILTSMDRESSCEKCHRIYVCVVRRAYELPIPEARRYRTITIDCIDLFYWWIKRDSMWVIVIVCENWCQRNINVSMEVPWNDFSDQDIHFINELWQSLMELKGHGYIISSAFRPSTYGYTERTNGFIEEYWWPDNSSGKFRISYELIFFLLHLKIIGHVYDILLSFL